MKLSRTALAVAAVATLSLGGAGATLGADAIPTVEVSGTVLGLDGLPVELEEAYVLEYETAASEPIKTRIDVAEDGSFTVALREWGTAEEPARAQFHAYTADLPVVEEDGCLVTRTPYGSVEIAVPGVVPVEPIAVVLDRHLESAICGGGLTATPHAPEPEPVPGITLPPTDVAPGARPAPASVGAMAGVLVGVFALALLSVRPRRVRPRD